MEEHPVPQNVTAFEFHLVGDMTLKQFGYLGGGAALAYVTYLLLFRPLPFLAVPIIVVLVLSGVAFAFLPIYERPLDHWVKAYFNAIFSATQRKFSSKIINPGTVGYEQRLKIYLQSIDPSNVSPAGPNLAAISQHAPAAVPIVADPAISQSATPIPMPLPQPVIPVKPTPPPQTPAPLPPAPMIQSMPQPIVPKVKQASNLPPVPRPNFTPQPVNQQTQPQVPTLAPALNIGNAHTEYAPVSNQSNISTDHTSAHFMTPVASNPPVQQVPPLADTKANLPTPQPISKPVLTPTPIVMSNPNPVQPAPIQNQTMAAPQVTYPQQTPIPNKPISAQKQPPPPTSSVNDQTMLTATNLPFQAQQMQATPSLQFANADDKNLDQIVKFAKDAQIIHSEIIEVEKEMQDIKNQALVNPTADKNKISQDYQAAAQKLQKLTTEESTVSRQLASLSKAPTAAAQPNVKVVKAEVEPTERFVVLTTTPNIINGIVTDAMGNYLEGVIVVTHNKDGLPVRALKTNKLGQFLAATPLGNGTYTLSLEKDSLSFDVLQLDLDGSVLPPVKISAKKGAGLS